MLPPQLQMLVSQRLRIAAKALPLLPLPQAHVILAAKKARGEMVCDPHASQIIGSRPIWAASEASAQPPTAKTRLEDDFS